MKSLILTSLYLIKDTLHRWKERPASPLSRVLVAFFLSLCALSFLANYVLSAKMLHQEIRRNGADLVMVYDSVGEENFDKQRLIQQELPKQFDCDVITLKSPQVSGAKVGNVFVTIMEYNMESCYFLRDLGIDTAEPILLFNPQFSRLTEGPCQLEIGDFSFSVRAKKLPDYHMLGRMFQQGVVLVSEGTFSTGEVPKIQSYRYVIRVKEMTAENIRNIEDVLTRITNYDEGTTMVQTYVSLLNRLEILMNNQLECRTGFCLGIACVVGILLTALASMEFRQNEYVYTLMKSFGVRPILLVFTFIFENIFLISASFVAAVFSFMQCQKIVLGEFFKLGNSVLTFVDIEQDLMLLAISLLLCVLLSSIPVAFSAYRPIGKVLK